MHVLRAEKGYIIVGQDTDGTVTPDDAGLAWAIGKTKADFVGKRSLTRPAMSAPDRKQLVGLATAGSARGARGRRAGHGAPGRARVAHRARSATSLPPTTAPSSNARLRWRLVTGGRARLGADALRVQPAAASAVQVTSPVFYDPQGSRLNG